MFNSSFRRIKSEHKFEVVDEGSTTFRSEHHYLVEVIKPTRFFFRQFFWTGSDNSDETTILETAIDQWGHPLHRLHGPIIRENRSRIVIVDLGRTLVQGHREEITFRHNLSDLKGTFEPRFSYTAKPNDGELSIRVLLPLSFGQATFHLEAADTHRCLETDELIPQIIDKKKAKFEYNIPLVEQNRRYTLSWALPA